MKNLETAFYAGIGMAIKGKAKVEQMAKQFAKDSKMDAKEGKVFVDKAVKQAEAAKKELAKHIDESVNAAAAKMGFISKKEADMLKAEIKKLKDQLGKKPAKAKAKTKKK
ncbi:polyhydroxyalkanoate synthesis regulator phasin [Elusimicrobium posterum]|uniref:phasin family protein n=1 Tax=Elusimicrobium posterum TaxID=3116653 RepID=UPI003C737778